MFYICNIRGGVLWNKEAFCEVSHLSYMRKFIIKGIADFGDL